MTIAISLAVLIFVLTTVISTPHIENLVLMVSIIVANVPEEILVTIIVFLTLTSKQMHTEIVLINNIEGVETLDSTL